MPAIVSHGLVESGRVRIRDRKPELCGDFVSMNRILEDDIAAVPADVYLMTHVTNPLLSVGTIRRAVTAYRAAIGSRYSRQPVLGRPCADALLPTGRFSR